MKKFILNVQKNSLVYIFAIVGVILIIFPSQISGAISYIIGISSLLYTAVNIYVSVRKPEIPVRLGNAVVQGVIGILALLMKESSISFLGVIWAMLSLKEVAEEIDEFRETKKFSLISAISALVSIVLAAMLMMDPFQHFVMHVRILGIEILLLVLTRQVRKLSK